MISRCPSCAAQVADDATRCPSCHWDFVSFKHIPPAGQAANPTVAPKNAAPPSEPKLPSAKSLPPPPTAGPGLPKARAKAELPDAGPEVRGPFSAPDIRPVAPPSPSDFKIPTFKPVEPNTFTPPVREKPKEKAGDVALPEKPKAKEPELPGESIRLQMRSFAEDTEPPSEVNEKLPPRPTPKPAPRDLLKDLPRERPEPKKEEPPRERERERDREPEPPPKTEPRGFMAPPPPPDAVIPQTVIARRSDLPKPERKEEAARGSAPSQAAKEPAGVPEKLRRHSPTDGQPSKEIKKRVAGADPIALIAVAALVIAAGAVAVTKFALRSEDQVGTRPSRGSLFTEPATPAPAPEAAPAPAPAAPATEPAFQRVAIDPSRPELGAVPVNQAPAAAAPQTPAASPLPVNAPVAAPAPAPAPVPVSSPAVARAPAAVAASQPATPSPKPADTLPAPRGIAVESPVPVAKPEPPKPAPEKWLFEGEVYDGISLRAVAFAQITFTGSNGKVAGEAVTRETGRYRVSLPPDEAGYTVGLKHPDYQARYLDDVDPPLKRLEEDERRALLGMNAVTKPFKGNTKGSTRRDLVAVPNHSEP